MEKTMTTVEYRVRPVTRYIITRYVSENDGGSVEGMGEFQSEVIAGNACQAFADAETLSAQPADVVIDGCPHQPRKWTRGVGWSTEPMEANE